MYEGSHSIERLSTHCISGDVRCIEMDEFDVIFSNIKGGDMYGKKSITGGN